MTHRFIIGAICSILALVVASAYTWQLNLGEIDWVICFENYDNGDLLGSVSDLAFKDQLIAIQNQPLKNKLVPFIATLIMFAPCILAITFTETKWKLFASMLLLIISISVSVSFFDDPESTHHCDRKGTYRHIELLLFSFMGLLNAFLVFAIGITGKNSRIYSK